MGNCRYCGSKAGFLNDVHESCLTDAQAALIKLRDLMTRAVMEATPAAEVAVLISAIVADGRLSKQDAEKTLLSAANGAALEVARQRPLDEHACKGVYDLFCVAKPALVTDQQQFLNNPGYASVALSHTVFQVLHGQVPYWDPAAQVSFQINRGETPIVQRNAILAQYRTISRGSGYQSVGFPIGGGIYYRIADSAPRTQQTGLVPLEEGKMMLTTKAIYFGGMQHNFRLPYESILRLEPFVDAVGVFPNHGSGKVFLPGSLGFDDGWFFYNLISALVSSNQF